MKLHTATLNGGTRLSWVRIRLVLLLLACFAAVFSTRAQSSHLLSSNRFLFIIDASASMKPFDSALRESVFDLINSGIRGRMTNGDTYGLWVVTDKNDTSFPMNTWRMRSGVEMGVKATAHVKDRGFKGKSRLDLAMADALRVVKNVGDLTIVLVSNGETPLVGTPFDAAINARFRELAPRMKRAKATLNTAIVAQDGVLVAWAVNEPEYLINVPNVEPKPKSNPEVVSQQTNSPASSSNLVAQADAARPMTNSPAPTSTKPRVSPSIIITKDTVAQEKRAFSAMTSTATNNSIGEASTTNSTAAQVHTSSETVSPVAAVTQAAVVLSNPHSNAPATLAHDAATPGRPVSSSELASPIPATKPDSIETEKTITPATTIASAGKPIPASASQPRPTSSGFYPVMWTLIGAAAALLCVIVGIIAARSRRQESSLISQAIAHQRII